MSYLKWKNLFFSWFKSFWNTLYNFQSNHPNTLIMLLAMQNLQRIFLAKFVILTLKTEALDWCLKRKKCGLYHF